MRFEYSNQLTCLKSRVIDFGKTIESIFTNTINSVENVDLDASFEVIQEDVRICAMEREIENECLRIISLQRPFASDLRLVTGYLKIISDLQRVAVHCADICEIILMKNLLAFAHLFMILEKAQLQKKNGQDILAMKNVAFP